MKFNFFGNSNFSSWISWHAIFIALLFFGIWMGAPNSISAQSYPGGEISINYVSPDSGATCSGTAEVEVETWGDDTNDVVTFDNQTLDCAGDAGDGTGGILWYGTIDLDYGETTAYAVSSEIAYPCNVAGPVFVWSNGGGGGVVCTGITAGTCNPGDPSYEDYSLDLSCLPTGTDIYCLEAHIYYIDNNMGIPYDTDAGPAGPTYEFTSDGGGDGSYSDGIGFPGSWPGGPWGASTYAWKEVDAEYGPSADTGQYGDIVWYHDSEYNGGTSYYTYCSDDGGNEDSATCN